MFKWKPATLRIGRPVSIWGRLYSNAFDVSETNSSSSQVQRFVRGQPIQFTVLKFGHIGASVRVITNRTDYQEEGNDDGDDGAFGLVLQSEIAYFRDRRGGDDVMIGDILDGFVERVRDDGRLDVALRPIGLNRIKTVREIVLDALEGSPQGLIPVGDKSSADNIRSYFHGISKVDFKNAVGSLYRDGIARPGPFETSLIPEEERTPQRGAPHRKNSVERRDGESADNEQSKSMKPPRLPSDRDISKSVFIGNLPFTVNEKILLNTLRKKLGEDTVREVRLVMNDETGKPRGFAYIELNEASLVESSMAILKGFEVMGRKLRVDFADPSRRKSREIDLENKRFAGENSDYIEEDDMVTGDNMGRVAGERGSILDRLNRRAAQISGSSTEEGIEIKSSRRSNVAASNTYSVDDLLSDFPDDDVERNEEPNKRSIRADTPWPNRPNERGTSTRRDRESFGVGSERARDFDGSSFSGGDGPSRASSPRERDEVGAIRGNIGRPSPFDRRREPVERGDRPRDRDFPVRRDNFIGDKRGRDFPNRSDSYESGNLRRDFTPRDRDHAPRPRYEATVFIGNLAYKVDESILREEVERCIGPGSVASVRIAEEPETGRKRGFGYVDLVKRSDLAKVLSQLEGAEIMGRVVRVDDATR